MTAREWFQRAKEENFAIGAFNIDSLEIFKAVCLAGQRKKSPVMLEFSPGEAAYFGLKNIIDLTFNAREEYKIPILLNLDHANSLEDCLAAVDASISAHPRGVQGSDQAHPGGETGGGVGFDDIHFDGSELPYEENVANTKKVVEVAHARSLLVEGEIDRISGFSGVHTEDVDLETLKRSYTDPATAAKFAAETGIDIFAAVFGNVHGTFPNQPDLNFELLSKIKQALPNTFLSMHGGSGIPADQVREAIKIGGIVKVNVNTEIRVAFHDALVEKINEDLANTTYYKITPDIINAVAAVVEGKIDVFGSEGKG